MHWRFKPSSGLATDRLPYIFGKLGAPPLVAGHNPVKWGNAFAGRPVLRRTPGPPASCEMAERAGGLRRMTARSAHDNGRPAAGWAVPGLLTCRMPIRRPRP